MEIKLELDEAAIIRKAMQGLSKKEIEKWAADQVKRLAQDKILAILNTLVN